MAVLDKLKLDGKIAVVTGAGRGLGRAMALALADAGCDIVAAARTRPQIKETAELVRANGRRSLVVNVREYVEMLKMEAGHAAAS